MSTWGAVHVGDTVRGADQRAWEVVGARPGVTWLGDGKTTVHLSLRLGDRRVDHSATTDTPVEIVSRGDHSDMAAACAALLDHGITFDLLGETTLTADQFTAPAGSAKVERDRWGRYKLPDPATGEPRVWTRVSTVARTLADEFNLTKWKLRQVARGMALRPDLVAGAAAADPEADKNTLNKIADQAMERAGSSAGANLGTALHTFTQRLDRGEPAGSLGVPDALIGDMRAYVDAMKRHRLRVAPEHVERIVVLPELGVAGTLDRIVSQPPGQTKAAPRAVLDLKTAKPDDNGGLSTFSMLEIAIQLALYSHAPLMWNQATRTYEPMPADVDKDRALVLHLPVGKAHGALYGVNIIEGWAYAQLSMQVRAARSNGKGLCWLVEPDAADLNVHRVKIARDRAELARLWEQLHPAGLWTKEVNDAAAARFEQLKGDIQAQLEDATWD